MSIIKYANCILHVQNRVDTLYSLYFMKWSNLLVISIAGISCLSHRMWMVCHGFSVLPTQYPNFPLFWNSWILSLSRAKDRRRAWSKRRVKSTHYHFNLYSLDEGYVTYIYIHYIIISSTYQPYIMGSMFFFSMFFWCGKAIQKLSLSTLHLCHFRPRIHPG